MVYFRAMIDRESDLHLVRTALKRSRVVALLGPRQCGKTTLARQFVSADSLNYFDLEDPQSVARLSGPDLALHPLGGTRGNRRDSAPPGIISAAAGPGRS